MKLEIGYRHPFEIRRYRYASERLAGLRILYLSDFHFNRFGKALSCQIVSQIRDVDPHIILLGGDYADSGSGLHSFQHMMESIAYRKNIFAVSGNHDRRRLDKIKKIATACNCTWIDDRSVFIEMTGIVATGSTAPGSTPPLANTIHIRIDGIGAAQQPTPAHPSDTGSPGITDHSDPAQHLCSTPASSSDPDLSILCLHKPIDIAPIAHRYDLAFAGHLHGSQAVFWQTGNGLYPGRLLYRWNRLSHRTGGCRYLISKGLGDTLPIRYNCRKDAILVEFLPISPRHKKTPAS